MTPPADSRECTTDQPLIPQILAALAEPHTLLELSADLDITDSRLEWHLEALKANGHLQRNHDGRWVRTETGGEFASRLVVVADGPFSSSVYDLDQAYAEARAGLYGSTYIQRAGHHASRLSENQATAFLDRLQALIAEYFEPGQGDRAGLKYGLSWAATRQSRRSAGFVPAKGGEYGHDSGQAAIESLERSGWRAVAFGAA